MTSSLSWELPEGLRVTRANQLLAPYNRWSFHHETLLNTCSPVWRGTGAFRSFPPGRTLEGVHYTNRLGTDVPWQTMLEMSFTDAVVVVHRGRVVDERYLNGRPEDLRAWASASKSLVGLLTTDAAARGLVDLGRTIGSYLPELARSGFSSATVAQVLDRKAAVGFPDNDPDPVSESAAYARCQGWKEMSGAPEPLRRYLTRMPQTGPHGQTFAYQTPQTDVLAWVLCEVTGLSLTRLLEDRLWTRLGAQRDGAWITNPEGIETAGSGFLSTTRDMALVGQAILEGMFEAPWDPTAPAAYRRQWWLFPDRPRTACALGYGGQMLYLAADADLVVAKHSSFPTPTTGGQEFFGGMGAFPALADWLTA